MRAASLLLVLSLAGCAIPFTGVPDDRLPPPDPRVTVEPDGDDLPTALGEMPAPAVTGAGQVVTVGAADGESVVRLSSELPVEVDVVERDGGSVHPVIGPLGTPALLFPPYSSTDEPARAVVRVVPQEGLDEDPLGPGSSDFAFGADFAVDDESHGTEVDTGNNLIQRGLASDPSQFKIEVDNLRPTCRLQGSGGVVETRAETRILPDRWYRVRCSRDGDVVELTVSTLRGGTPRVVEQVRATGQLGELQWSAGTPLSIGGKLAADGTMIRSATDQFNGVVGMPVLQIDRDAPDG